MIPLNECEWLIEPFYESQIRGLAWSLEPGAARDVAMRPQWQAVHLNWSAAEPGGRVARLERAVDLPLLDADRLGVRASVSETCRLTLRAEIDQQTRTVIDRVAGSNVFHEFEGPVTGERLNRLVLEIHSDDGAQGEVNLLWLIAIDSAARERRHRLTPVYDPTWPALMRAEEGADATLEPLLGLFLPADGVAGLRRRAKAPAYEAARRHMERQAERIQHAEPERSVREHLNTDGRTDNGRYAHDAGPPIDPDHAIAARGMVRCALLGLIENDPAWSRLAVRHALAAMHCTHWEDSFMSTRPGGLWDHRAFTALLWLEAVVCTVDWAGALLTDAGRDLVARALSEKVLPRVDWSLRRYAYMRKNNQGLFFASAGILATCTLGRLVPHSEAGLDDYLDVLRHCTENYFRADGGAHEGAVYHEASCGRALQAFAAAALFRGESETALMPDRLLETQRYYRVMASTAQPGGAIRTGDGGRLGTRFSEGPPPGAVPWLARLSGDASLRGLTAALAAPDADGEVPSALSLLTQGPDQLPAPDPSPPTFERLPETGQLCACRPTEYGPVRLQLIGSEANAGHSHEDKGSFILEAFGEELLIDRGICFYGDARSTLLKQAVRHNMLTPDQPDGRPAAQLNPLPEAVIPAGEGDATTLHARIDATAGFPELLRHWERRIDSDTPTRFTLTDLAERHETGTVSVHFQSRQPWVRDGDAWITETPRARLTLTPRWEPAEADAEEDLFDGLYHPVYRLTLRTSPDTRFQLEHTLELHPPDPSHGEPDEKQTHEGFGSTERA